jgi:hypothetical protein
MATFLNSEHDINDWVADEILKVPSIVCAEPEFHKGGMMTKSFVDFRVTATYPSGEIRTIRHRFSEFEVLRKSLMGKYLKYGIVVPPLPPKTTFSTNSSTDIESPFLKERIQGLTLFCRHLVNNLFLANDNDWFNFITGEPRSGDNKGEKVLTTALGYLEQPFKFTIGTRIDEMKNETNTIEMNTKTAMNNARKLQDAERALQSAFTNFNDSVQAWSSAEVSSVKSLNGFPFDGHESIISTQLSTRFTINQYSDMDLARHVAKTSKANFVGIFLVSLLQFEITLVEAFREAFKFHDELTANHAGVGKKMEQAGAAPDKRHKVEEYSAKLDELKIQMEQFYKGFVYFTLPSIARVRAGIHRETFTHKTATTLVESCVSHEASLTYFKEMGISPMKWVDLCSSQLEDLGMSGLSKSAPFFGVEGAPGQDIPNGPGAFAGLFDAARTGNYAPLTGGGDTTIYKDASAPATTNSTVEDGMGNVDLNAGNTSGVVPDPPFTNRGSVAATEVPTATETTGENWDNSESIGI